MDATKVIERIGLRILVDPTTGCWLYQGYCNRDGYAVVSIDGESRLFHRVMFEIHVRPLEKWEVVDHLNGDRGPCRHRNCGNPEHLQAVTVTVNAQAVIPWNRSKLVCPDGHPYDRISKGKDGYERRHCTTCDRRNARLSRLARKLKVEAGITPQDDVDWDGDEPPF